MKNILVQIIVLGIILLGSATPTKSIAQSNDEVPFKKGTWTNTKLRQDSIVGMRMKLTSMGCKEDPVNIQPYIVKDPNGSPGNKQWVEVWSVSSCGNEYRMVVYFKEDGKGGATYTFK